MGEILKITKDKVTIRNAASNRKKTFDIGLALAIPPVGSFLKGVSGQWHKVMQTEGRGATLAAVHVLPNEKAAKEKTGTPMCFDILICVLQHSFVLHRQSREGENKYADVF